MKRGTPMSNSESRKRQERQSHPDPAVRELIARAWDQGHDECCAVYIRHCAHALNPYRSGRTP